MIQRFVLCLGAVAITTAVLAVETQYTQSADVPPLNVSYKHFLETIESTRKSIREINGLPERQQVSEQLIFVARGKEITLKPPFSVPQRIPPYSFAVRYHYKNPDALISVVALHLRDYKREVVVEGTSSEQVEALCAFISNELRQYATIGGVDFRIVLSLFMIIAGLFLILLGSFVRSWRATIIWQVSVLITVFLPVLFLILPGKIFPGMVIYHEGSLITTRYAPLIAILGIFGLPGLILSGVIKLSRMAFLQAFSVGKRWNRRFL